MTNHVEEAEKLIQKAVEGESQNIDPRMVQHRQRAVANMLARAQVHATLALVEVTGKPVNLHLVSDSSRK